MNNKLFYGYFSLIIKKIVWTILIIIKRRVKRRIKRKLKEN